MDNSNAPTPTTNIPLNPPALPFPVNVVYDISITPWITSIEPRYGTVEGGTLVVFTGLNLEPLGGGVAKVFIDDVECTGAAATATTITCTTGPRLGEFAEDPKLVITLED